MTCWRNGASKYIYYTVFKNFVDAIGTVLVGEKVKELISNKILCSVVGVGSGGNRRRFFVTILHGRARLVARQQCCRERTHPNWQKGTWV